MGRTVLSDVFDFDFDFDFAFDFASDRAFDSGSYQGTPSQLAEKWDVSHALSYRELFFRARSRPDFGDPQQVLALAKQALRDDEWRLQRIRPFDWYGVDFKRQAQRELQASYWKMWDIEVRCAWKAGQPEKADQLLAQMEDRAAALGMKSDPLYETAKSTLARLHAEEKQSARP